jgi:hypothetical protein
VCRRGWGSISSTRHTEEILSERIQSFITGTIHQVFRTSGKIGLGCGTPKPLAQKLKFQFDMTNISSENSKRIPKTPPQEKIVLTPESCGHLRRWSGVLRSGEYKQVKGALMITWSDCDVGYCCLGVERILSGCKLSEYGTSWFEVYDPNTLFPKTEEEIMIHTNHIEEYDSDTWYLNDLPGANLPFNENTRFLFSELNDECRLTFDQIADVIDYIVDNN